MGGCSAIGCSNSTRNGHRMVKFPRNEERRRIWIIKCRRANWEPGVGAQLCLEHFEESQFESLCKDRKKLRKTAIPTLFNFPDSPSATGKRMKGPNTQLERNDQKGSVSTPNEELLKRIKVLERQKAVLEREIVSLKEQILEKDSKLSSFLCSSQIAALGVDKYSISIWSDKAIIKALEIRFALGKRGYNYLRSTGYPLPAWSTLNRRIVDISSAVKTEVESSTLHEDPELWEDPYSD